MWSLKNDSSAGQNVKGKGGLGAKFCMREGYNTVSICKESEGYGVGMSEVEVGLGDDNGCVLNGK